MRCHSGVAADTRTLPRTSDGQNGAVAVLGNLNIKDPIYQVQIYSGRPLPHPARARGFVDSNDTGTAS
jgi:hypothetical protein